MVGHPDYYYSWISSSPSQPSLFPPAFIILVFCPFMLGSSWKRGKKRKGVVRHISVMLTLWKKGEPWNVSFVLCIVVLGLQST